MAFVSAVSVSSPEIEAKTWRERAKNAGHRMKNAAKSAGRKMKGAAKSAGRGMKKAGHSIKSGAENVGKAAMKGASLLELQLGFSHPINFTVPAGIEVTVDKNTLVVKGNDKQLVGQLLNY